MASFVNSSSSHNYWNIYSIPQGYGVMSFVKNALFRFFLVSPQPTQRRALVERALESSDERGARLAFLQTQTRSLLHARRVEQLALPILQKQGRRTLVKSEAPVETRVRIIDDSQRLPAWDLRRHL